MKTTKSWVATARLACDEWQRGDTSKKYTVLVLQEAQRSVAKTKKKQSSKSSDASAPSVKSLNVIEDNLQAVRQAVERDDRSALAIACAQLPSRQEALDSESQRQ